MNDYDLEKPSTFITYLDKNNLYGWSMSEYLPYEKFEQLENIDKFDVMSINEKNDRYFLEVDLEYPDELHEFAMIIHLLQKNLLFLVICFQNIVTKLLMNMI